MTPLHLRRRLRAVVTMFAGDDPDRAGYLTVAKGPGGVRVYGLKEGE